MESRFNRRYGSITKKILRELSENSRVPILSLSKKLGLPRRETTTRLKSIEKEFNIKYTLEIRPQNIGLTYPHIILIKFPGKLNTAEVKVLFEKSYIPQLVCKVNGKYDLLVFANAYSTREYLKWDRDMRRAMPCGTEWEHSDIIRSRVGFVPLRNEAIAKSTLPEKQRKILMALNKDSRMSVKRLSDSTGINYKQCVYVLNSLIKSGVISGFTITMGPNFKHSVIATFSKYTPPEDFAAMSGYAKMLFGTDEKDTLMDRCIMKMSLLGAADSFFMQVFDSFSAGYKNSIMEYKKLVGRLAQIKLSYGEITDTLIGNLPIRNLEAAKEYERNLEEKTLVD